MNDDDYAISISICYNERYRIGLSWSRRLKRACHLLSQCYELFQMIYAYVLAIERDEFYLSATSYH